MRKCEKCGVTVRGLGRYCPLCQSRLTGTPEEDIYPKIPTLYRQFAVLFRWMIFGSIAGCIICMAVNILIPSKIFWSLFVIIGVICFWLSFSFAIRKRDNIPQDLTIQVFLATIICIVWDLVTGWKGWSLDYVLPIACSGAMISLIIIAVIMKLQPDEYILYFIVDILYGTVTLLLLLTGVTHIVIPTIICITISLVSLTGLIIFQGKAMRQELIRRFHL
jgi:hypothetical protein